MTDQPFQLPENFHPAQHARTYNLVHADPNQLSEGVNVLHYNAATNMYMLAEKTGMVTRCWTCHKNQDGSIDCVRINCPWDPPSAPNKAD